MAKWTIAAKRGDFDAISSRFGVDKVVARLIRNRDIIGDAEIERYLFGGLDDLYAPARMKDLDKAAEILQEKIGSGRPIRVIGDYDVDGIMATYILVDALESLGADVDHDIPERIRDGYGINENLVRQAFSDGRDTIVTCDNGISACTQTVLAKELGMTVIITDHHVVPFEGEGEDRAEIIPPADAVVDPKQAACGYPYKELCGAAVAWKLVTRLFERMGLSGEHALSYLQFAAFATIEDVVELKDENRIIVREGLKQLHNTDHTGLLALTDACELDPRTIDPYHIGFILGPCLNASGRLETAELAFFLMRARSKADAAEAAKKLRDLNNVRKAMTEKGLNDAAEQIGREGLDRDRVLCVHLKDCHESLAGIIAGRLKEQYYRPAFVLTDSDGCIKGSGRSIEEYNMYEELSAVRDLFTRFGGHAMAAGISMENGMAEEFRRRINENCTLTEEDLVPKIRLDMVLPVSYLSEELVDQFKVLEPFGQGNRKPLFAAKDLLIRTADLIGKNRSTLKMQLDDGYGNRIEAICFRDAAARFEQIRGKKKITAAYYPSINEFRGEHTLQMVVVDLFTEET